LLNHLYHAIFNFPSVQDWLTIGGLSLLLALALIPIGFSNQFLQIEVVRSPKVILQIIATALVFPAITEELCFRVFLLPYPPESVSTAILWLRIVLSLVAFVIYHPLNAFTFFAAGRKTFIQPIFLLLAALLGAICTIAYVQTGSLWLPVFIHWIAVVVWLLFLGGYSKLYAKNLTPQAPNR
jgi:predicted Abi (CAAX) family protease